MGKELQVVGGPDQGRVFPIPEADFLLLGRSRALEARLTDPYVSRVHCQLQIEDGQVVVTDFESAGGTFVNDQRVTRRQLAVGDVLRIGTTSLQLQDTAAEPKTLPPEVPAPAVPSGDEELAKLVGRKFGNFEINSVLARGQSGLVFHGRDTTHDLPVAVKVLWPEIARDDEQRQRFVRAMKTMLPLQHPNLVNLRGAGKAGAYCWMAMEYVEGESLTQVIQRIGTLGMLDWKNALRVAVHVARALDFAHRHQVIHRNVTPMNILIQAGTKTAKLGDLMLAKALEGTLAQQITKPGELLGNVYYLSPERTHQDAAQVDGRSDFYSLGATVYALLTGRPPFEAATLTETLQKIRQEEPVRPKKYQLAIPDLFEGVVLRMLAKRPEDRFQKAGEMLAELERVAKFQGQAV
jgi:serine/threonine protein kinase